MTIVYANSRKRNCFFQTGSKSVRTKPCTEQQSGNSFHLPAHMAHTQKGLETVLPGICFTVVFSGNNILKELPTSNPGEQKNKGGYRAHAHLAQGCTGRTWPPVWAPSCSLCGDLQHRGARAELYHRPAAQGSQGRAPPPWHQCCDCAM